MPLVHLSESATLTDAERVILSVYNDEHREGTMGDALASVRRTAERLSVSDDRVRAVLITARRAFP